MILSHWRTPWSERRRVLAGQTGDRHAVTMTAELSQAFHTKREGVEFILDALEATFVGVRALRVHRRRQLPFAYRSAEGSAFW